MRAGHHRRSGLVACRLGCWDPARTWGGRPGVSGLGGAAGSDSADDAADVAGGAQACQAPGPAIAVRLCSRSFPPASA